MNNKWVSVKVLAAPFFLEQLSGPIFASGAQGIQEQENDFTIFYDYKAWNQDLYLTLLKMLTQAIPDFDETRIVVETHDAQNWMENWKRNFKPFKVGKHLIVVPDWENVQPKTDEIVLKIAPKMAFGTGHHETTQLCLQLMEKYFSPNMHFLDAGTGSGILSIFAAKLGGKHILGIDDDPQAIENAIENAQLNHVQNQVVFKVADVAALQNQTFDMIVANINRNVLLEAAKNLAERLEVGGWLVLSGILVQDAEPIQKAYEIQGLTLIEQEKKGEWLGLVFRKES